VKGRVARRKARYATAIREASSWQSRIVSGDLTHPPKIDLTDGEILADLDQMAEPDPAERA